MRIALIGYAEVGRIFGRALVARGVARVTAHDTLHEDALRGREMRARAARDGLQLAATAAAATAEADLIISAVTASATHDVAASAAQDMCPGALLLDINSASPGMKAECGALVAERGDR